MKHSTFNYVRACRQRYGLTEEELAFLVDYEARNTISLIETGDRTPKLEAALAFQVVFGMAPKELFPEVYEHVEDAVMRRARVLHERLEESTDERSKVKLSLLEEMARRRDEDKLDQA